MSLANNFAKVEDVEVTEVENGDADDGVATYAEDAAAVLVFIDEGVAESSDDSEYVLVAVITAVARVGGVWCSRRPL